MHSALHTLSINSEHQILARCYDPGQDGDPVVEGAFSEASQARGALLPAPQWQHSRLRSAVPVSAWSAEGWDLRNLLEGRQVNQALAGAAAEEHWGDVQPSSRTAAAGWTAAASSAASTSKGPDTAPDFSLEGKTFLLLRCKSTKSYFSLTWVQVLPLQELIWEENFLKWLVRGKNVQNLNWERTTGAA